MRGGDPFIYKSLSNDSHRSPLDITVKTTFPQLPPTYIYIGGWEITISIRESQPLLDAYKNPRSTFCVGGTRDLFPNLGRIRGSFVTYTHAHILKFYVRK